MKKKITLIIAALLVLLIAFGGLNYYKSLQKDDSNKQITIIIKDGDKEILNQTYSTNGTYLKDLLLELVDQNAILLQYQDSEYGMYITGLGTDELLLENPQKGMYWTYNSENNVSCVSDGYCQAASLLKIDDGDIFSFELISYEASY